MKLREITAVMEEFAPLSYQESYDNSGLLIGDYDMEVKGILLCIDVTDAVIDEAISLGVNLIISYHPLIFSGLKRVIGDNLVERCVIKAIKSNIAVYSAHTNMDNVFE
ncbi:MAG: Nif3-like dinuclear metal center hexameric protein, partial [Fibrobacter sp.]|nr:Nif3-like dinuclear metal center hexameric protein [Fibrobacter sp.]